LKAFIFGIILFFTSCVTSFCQKNYWQQQVNYNIDVILNDANHTLNGFIKIEYINNSPDTLYFIWFHVWPNAYKNDRTAFSDQFLQNGRTDFYFSNEDKKGYINQMKFRVNGVNAIIQDHPQHQDIIKLQLPTPLAPNSSCKIETPFNVKLPYNFSRGGHVGQTYQITQWYPKPAVYDITGWHPMPYVDQGEFYSEFGNYNVQITLPEQYVVAATGILQNVSEQLWLQGRSNYITPPIAKPTLPSKKKLPQQIKPNNTKTKTLQYQQNNVHDFAWFASKDFTVQSSKIKLNSGKVIDAYVYYYSKNEAIWRNSLQFVKQAISTKSNWLGEYPYDIVSVVEDEREGGGMEYPTITLLSHGGSEKELDLVINHEIGHNWFYGILASNERQYPWMDEGMNTYYDNRYINDYYNGNSTHGGDRVAQALQKRFPENMAQLMLQSAVALQQDQPIATHAEAFTASNYNNIAYTKAGNWLLLLQKELGNQVFDSCMKVYYQQWKFKHPTSENFKQVLQTVSGKNVDAIFELLDKKGNLTKSIIKKQLKLSTVLSANKTDAKNYIFIAPAAGYNFYDKLMVGALVHNYTLPATKFRFAASPLISTKNKGVNGIGKLSYHWFPKSIGGKAEVGFAAASFNGDSFTDSTTKINYQRFSKIVPSFKYVFVNKKATSSITKFVQWKTFFINETNLLFTRDTVNQVDVITYPVESRYVNQLRFVVENDRVLYPYKGILQAEQANTFIRATFEGNYFFNFAQSGGLQMRLFAGRYFNINSNSERQQSFYKDRSYLTMTGPRGEEDFTYSNYYIGRNEFEGVMAQQLMVRDGGFKVGTNLSSQRVGKTDKWLAAVNLSADVPNRINPLSILPIKIPIKLFLDVGTSATTWDTRNETGRFVYDAGLQLSILKNTIDIYVPVLYSKVYRNYKSIEPKTANKIAFSINFNSDLLKKAIPFSGL
jgi:hypothetical protein